MTTPTTPAADAAQHREIVSRLQDEADQARNDGANDIAQLLDDAVAHIQQRALEFLSAEAQADERESALVAERDALRAIVNLALAFTEANDRGDKIGQEIEDGGFEDDLFEVSDQADVDYNQTKADLFAACRALAAPAVEG